ncbi:CoA transferase [Pseudonocardia endophytica]|uniref:CoA transferase family III n=1 Tax=Pseudonocardia endophytica TaxID=401976 RepID=A0A4R1HVK2_PSEEN|nr:CoA transferase [Pseudonocardia endophytica]TCK26308.1 CoA transferase family III [Pseudonocardia endophytica]
MSALTDRLHEVTGRRETTADVDAHSVLADVLGGVGTPADAAGGTVTFTGADPVVPSTLRLGTAAGVGLAAKSVAMAALWRHRTGQTQDVAMDLRVAPHRLCPFYDRKWELLGGYPPTSTAEPHPAMAFSFYRTADDRWVLPQNMYPGLRRHALSLLGSPDTKEAVGAAIGRWRAAELEQAAAEAGVVFPMLRTLPEFLAEQQYREHLADLPLIEVERIGDSAPEPFTPAPTDPLDGIRALGMGKVIAGAGIGRTLALHGADVLNIWRPTEQEHENVYYSANVGVRSTLLDPDTPDGRARLENLLHGADVFYHNRRPRLIDRLGLGPEQVAALRPGIVHVTASLHGLTGPWSDRPGFDQTAGTVTGMMLLEGDRDRPRLPPILVVNDYLVPWLASVGVARALQRRAEHGGSYRVHVSLTRTALWILGLGILDKQWARATAGATERHRYPDPETFRAETPCGDYQGVTDQVWMSRTPGRYRTLLVPRGSCRPEWRADRAG